MEPTLVRMAHQVLDDSAVAEGRVSHEVRIAISELLAPMRKLDAFGSMVVMRRPTRCLGNAVCDRPSGGQHAAPDSVPCAGTAPPQHDDGRHRVES